MISTKVIGAVLVRPGLWATAVVQLLRLAPTGWWRRWPFIPKPSAQYLDFRYVTQYGGQHHRLDQGLETPVRTQDVLDYLRWCKEWNSTR